MYCHHGRKHPCQIRRWHMQRKIRWGQWKQPHRKKHRIQIKTGSRNTGKYGRSVDSAQEKEDPTAIDMEAKEEEASKDKKEDGKTGQTDSGDQEKQPVQESGGAANDFKVEKKTKKKSENSTDKKKKKRKREMIHEQSRTK